MDIIRMSSKGQIVIPLKIRDKLGIEEGSIVGIERVNDVLVIKKVDLDLTEQFKRSLEDLKSGKIKKVA